MFHQTRRKIDILWYVCLVMCIHINPNTCKINARVFHSQLLIFVVTSPFETIEVLYFQTYHASKRVTLAQFSSYLQETDSNRAKDCIAGCDERGGYCPPISEMRALQAETVLGKTEEMRNPVCRHATGTFLRPAWDQASWVQPAIWPLRGLDHDACLVVKGLRQWLRNADYQAFTWTLADTINCVFRLP